MNVKERKALTILQQHLGGMLTAQEVAAELAITERQFYRIKRRFLDEGDAGLVHRGRGQPSNFSYAPVVKNAVLDIYRRKYADYGPTFLPNASRSTRGMSSITRRCDGGYAERD